MPNLPVDVNSWGRSACYPRRTFYPLSDGPSTQNHRITKSDFRPCSTRRSRSQAPLCLCALRLITDQPEGTFERLRYHLGGDRPSQTTHQTLSSAWINRPELESQISKGGISRATPRKLAPPLQSLPPILHIPIQHPVSSYSKGARGLSVLMRAPGFFTGTTNSLSIPPRQRSSRYAIHAGRNFMSIHSFLWHRLYVHLVKAI